MYGFYYPENGERFLEVLEFPTADDAFRWFADRRSTWDSIEAKGDDRFAFLNPRNGEIVVIREIPEAEDEE